MKIILITYIVPLLIGAAFVYMMRKNIQRKNQIFENACLGGNLAVIELDTNGKQAMEAIVRQMMAQDGDFYLRIDKVAHNIDNGDFACLVYHDERYLRRKDAMKGTALSGIAPAPRNGQYSCVYSIVMGRRLANPVYPVPVFYYAFPKKVSYDYVKRVNQEGVPGEGSNKFGHGFFAGMGKLFVASCEAEMPGQTRISPKHDLLAGMLFRGGEKLDDDTLLNGAGKDYWEQLAPNSDNSVLDMLQSWHFGFLPGWVVGLGRVAMIKPASPRTIWHSLLKRES